MDLIDRLIQKTGCEPNSCKCVKCQSQCKTPCLGTPQNIDKLIDEGYKHQLSPTIWMAGMLMGVVDFPIIMVQPLLSEGYCIFFRGGLCQLHDKGLKPIEGQLSNHKITLSNLDPHKSISWNVAKEWLNPVNNNIIKQIFSNYE